MGNTGPGSTVQADPTATGYRGTVYHSAGLPGAKSLTGTAEPETPLLTREVAGNSGEKSAPDGLEMARNRAGDSLRLLYQPRRENSAHEKAKILISRRAIRRATEQVVQMAPVAVFSPLAFNSLAIP